MLTVAIHQPEYFPPLGYFRKILLADVFVVLDDVQFKRDSLQQRCKIADGDKTRWLSIPFVHRHPQRIDEVEVVDPGWAVKHMESIRRAYEEAPRWPDAAAMLLPFWEGRGAQLRLLPTTEESVRAVLGALSISTQIVRSSNVGHEGGKGDLVLDICRRLGATRYLAGRTSAASYLDREVFEEAGIEIKVVSYVAPHYRERQPEDAGLSVLDAIAYLGYRAKDLIG